jgi:hypothetical protein
MREAMIYLGLWLLVLGVSAAQAASITQQTDGPCSPTVGHTGGNVSITMNCPGVDLKVHDALNRELGLTTGQLRLTKQQLEQKTREANEWFRKYQELSRHFEAIQDDKLTLQGKALLREGRLKEADALLRQSAISMDQYQAIQTGPTGMSIPEVVKILGRRGVGLGRSDHPSATVVNYMWRNGDGSGLAVVFVNGRASSKSQSGLRY